MSAAALPSLDALHRKSAKRTWAVFAAEAGDTFYEEESR